jgi:carboxymethylenebutenolidase
LLLAPGHGFSVSSVNYPTIGKRAYDPKGLAGACPIVGSYGAKDPAPFIRGADKLLERALTANGVDHDVKLYPNVGHSFLNNHSGNVLGKVLQSIRLGYDAPSAEDARLRIISFFKAHL